MLELLEQCIENGKAETYAIIEAGCASCGKGITKQVSGRFIIGIDVMLAFGYAGKIGALVSLDWLHHWH